MKQPRFAVFCHAADALPNPQGRAASRRRKNRFRSAGITFYKNSLKLVSEFHPRHPIFGFVGGFFVGLSVTLWLGMTLGGGYSMT